METKPPYSAVIYAITITAIVFFVVMSMWSSATPIDDAYTTFRFARNLANEGAFCFNPGIRAEGCSNHLWVALLAMFYKAGIAIPVAAKYLSMASMAGAIAVMAYTRSKVYGTPPFLVIIWMCSQISLWFWAGIGLETAFFSFLLATTLSSFLVSRHFENFNLPLFAALSLVVLCRVDGLAYAAIIALAACREKNNRQNMRAIIGALAIGTAFHLWRYLYFGSIFSIPMLAKGSTGLWRRIKGGTGYLVSYLITHGSIFIAAIAGWQAIKTKATINRIIISLSVFIVAFVLYTRGGWMPCYRYLVPLTVIVAPLTTKGLYELAKACGNQKSHIILPLLMLVYGVLSVLYMVKTDLPDERQYYINLHNSYKSIASQVKPIMKKNDIFACGEPGITGWYLNKNVFDLWGLVDIRVARLKDKYKPSAMVFTTGQHALPATNPAFKADFTKLFQQVNPEFVLLPSGATTIPNTLYSPAEFKAKYHEVPLTGLPVKLVLFKRNNQDRTRN